MPLTTLDPSTALILIDLQKGIVSLPTAHPAEEIVARAAQLATAFRRHGLPVFLVHVLGAPTGRTELPPRSEPPADWAELVPGLKQQPGDHVIAKRTWGAFTHTELRAQLGNYSVTQVVIAGIATSLGVESTARHAHELGFNVTLALDAMTDPSLEAHENSLTRIFPRLGEAGTTQQIIDLLPASRAI